MQNTNYDLSVMLDEAKNQLSRQFKSSATLREHAKTIIGVSSVVVSFFATFKIFDGTTSLSGYLVSLLILIALVYGALMFSAIGAASPFALEAPINPRRKDYTEAYADKPEREILAIQISLYLRAIEMNEDVIKEQSRLSKIVDYLLGATVFLIILSTALSLLYK